MTTFYLYTPFEAGGTCGYYEGKTVEANVAPVNSSPFAPQVSNTQTTYFDGMGWRLGPLYSTISDTTWIKCYTTLNSRTLTQAIQTAQAPYSSAEISTWSRQEADARAYIAGGTNATPTPFLSALATARKQTVAALSATIIAKADAYGTSIATALGDFQNTSNITAADAKTWCLQNFNIAFTYLS